LSWLLAQTLWSLVVVWADGPLLVHRTVPPTLMLTLAGVKEKF